MKTLPAALAAHVVGQSTTLAPALKITRLDGQVFAFTGASRDVVIDGVTYTASQGLDISSVEIAAGLAVSNLELATLDDGSLFSRAEILGGVWRNASFLLFRYNWASPSDGIDTLMVGTVGEVEIRSNTIVAELRGLQQYLQQPIGSVSSRTCRARLGDSLCGVNLASYTVSGTVTSVTDRQVFADSGRAEADDYFGEGILTFTSGPMNGQQHKVKSFSGGTFTLALPALQTVTVGTTYSVVAGCRKRLGEDCKVKFSNVLNFQGEPHLPGIDALTAPV